MAKASLFVVVSAGLEFLGYVPRKPLLLNGRFLGILAIAYCWQTLYGIHEKHQQSYPRDLITLWDLSNGCRHWNVKSHELHRPGLEPLTAQLPQALYLPRLLSM